MPPRRRPAKSPNDTQETDSSFQDGDQGEEFEDKPKRKNEVSDESKKSKKKKTWFDHLAANDLMYYLSLLSFALIGAAILRYTFSEPRNVLPKKSVPGSQSAKSQSGNVAPSSQAQSGKVPSSILSVGDDSKLHWQDNLEQKKGKIRVLSDKEIEYKEGGKFLLVIAGHVFDVTAGGKSYEKGSGYHGFIGRDGTRAFITGKFDDEGLVPDIDGLDNDSILGISKWINFYLNSDKYKFVGLHQGTFFDKKGLPTAKMLKFQDDVVTAKLAKLEEEKKEEVFPSCNMEWSQASGSRLWCSEKSGGIDRDWVGLPRILKEEGKEERCACVRDDMLDDPRLKRYKGCPADSVECKLKD